MDCAHLWILFLGIAGMLPPVYGDAIEQAGDTAPVTSVGAGTRTATPLPELGAKAEIADSALRWRNTSLITTGALAVGIYGQNKWWQDGFADRLRSVDEGWFEQNTASGGADKAGHTFANYMGTRLLARAFEEIGNDQDTALKLAAWTTFGTFMGVEVIDGYSKKWRFSKEDGVMNAAGVGLAVLMEKNPELDELLDFRLRYQPSTNRGQRRSFDPLGDYSGQTYLLVAKASGVPALRNNPLLRYLEIAVGYGARGYEEFTPGMPDERSRHVYYGIALNLSELLRQTAFRGSTQPGRTQRAINGLLEYIQVPQAAALADHRL